MNDNEKEFVKELEQLSRKYGLYISGCGCCGSPSIEKFDKPDETVPDAGYIYEDNLCWTYPSDFGWDGYDYKSKVIK